MTNLNETFRLERSASTWSFILLLTAGGLLAWGITQEKWDFAVGAILPLCVGLWLWLNSPRPQELIFGAEELIDEQQNFSMRYDEMCGISIAGNTPAVDSSKIRGGNLAVTDQTRCVEFPGLSARSAAQLYQSLIERIPESGSREVSPVLQERAQSDLDRFDDDLVLTYRARKNNRLPRKRFHTLFLVLVLVGIIWCVLGDRDKALDNWLVFGGFMAGFSLIVWMIYAAATFRQAPSIPNQALASLIISPQGIALHQGRLTGEMTWDEMKSIHCGKVGAGNLATAQTPRAISIIVDGAQVVIHDIYDRPLATIHRAMQRYWAER